MCLSLIWAAGFFKKRGGVGRGGRVRECRVRGAVEARADISRKVRHQPFPNNFAFNAPIHSPFNCTTPTCNATAYPKPWRGFGDDLFFGCVSALPATCVGTPPWAGTPTHYTTKTPRHPCPRFLREWQGKTRVWPTCPRSISFLVFLPLLSRDCC